MNPVLVAQSLMLLAHAAGIGRDHHVAFAVGDDEIALAHRMVLAGQIDGYLATWERNGNLEILARARTTELDGKLAAIVDALVARLADKRIARAEPWTTWRDGGVTS